MTLTMEQWRQEIERLKRRDPRPPGSITVDELAEQMGVSHRTAERLTSQGVQEGRYRKVTYMEPMEGGRMHHRVAYQLVENFHDETGSPADDPALEEDSGS